MRFSDSFNFLNIFYDEQVTEMFYGHEPLINVHRSASANACRRFGVAVACRSARADRCRPFKCSHCGRRSNWRWDLKKHIRASRHPNAEIIELSDEEARRSFQAIIFKCNSLLHVYLNYIST